MDQLNQIAMAFPSVMARLTIAFFNYLKAKSHSLVSTLQLASATGQMIAAMTYFLLAKFGMTLFSLTPSNITLLWLPSGLALIMCLRWGIKALPWIALASFAANINGMGGLGETSAILHTCISALIDASAGIISATMFKRFLPHGLTYIQDLLKLVFAVCLFTTLLTSLALAVNLYIGNYIQQSEVFAFVRMLVFADSLGILLLFPIYQGWQHRFNLTSTELKWLGAGFAALVTIFALVAVDMAYAIFFILPVLLVLAFNIKLFELGMVMALSMATVTAFTAADMGPLISDIELETNFRLMSFLFASSLTILGIALQNQQLALSEDLVATWKDAATTDSLTGILNRRAFFSLSRNEVQRINLEERPSYSIAMLDLDQFKYINDTHGHAVGDLVLREFAQLLQSHCRKVDIAARVGGEEFAVFLPQCSRDYATRVMNRIREALAMHSFTVGHKTIDVTVSIGVASLQNNSDTLDDVLTRADLALYQAKGKRNRVVTSADGDLIP